MFFTDLWKQIAGTLYRSCNQLRKKGNECGIDTEILFRFNSSSIHINYIAQRLESIKRNTNRQQYIQCKRLKRNSNFLQDRCNRTTEEIEIFKYQCADAILAEVIDTYLRKSNVTILKKIKKQSKKLMAVYSPIHRIGKTTFALAMGRELAQKEKTLYLNLEGYSSIQGEGKDLGELLYYVRQDPESLGNRLSMIVKRQEALDYVIPMEMITDLKEISVNEWKNFLQRVVEESIYETVVLDLGDCVDGVFEILQLCDWVYMPVLEDEVSHQKVCRFEETLLRIGLDGILRKITKFAAPDDIEAFARKLVREERV